MSKKKKQTPVLEKNPTSVTPAPFMVLDHSALSKKLSADKCYLSSLSPGFRDDQRSIEVTGGGSAGWFSAISKKFFKRNTVYIERKKEIENILCSKITVTSPNSPRHWRGKPNRKSKEA